MMMRETQPSYRLHKRGGCCQQGNEDPEDEDVEDTIENDRVTKLNLMAKRLRERFSGNKKSQGNKYFPGLNRFRPAYPDWQGIMDQVGK